MGVRRFVAVLCAILTPAETRAGGPLVAENGSQAAQRAGAFVARADDPTALTLNPAGLGRAAAEGWAIFVGANFLDLALSFDRAGTYPDPDPADPVDPSWVGKEYPEVRHVGPPQLIPHLAAAWRRGRLGLGVGLFAPHAYGARDFPESIASLRDADGRDAPAPQRYDAVMQDPTFVFPSVGASYRLAAGLEIGARASWGVATIEARSVSWGLENDRETPARESVVRVRGARDAFVPAFGLGLLYRWRDGVELGASFSSAVSARARGRASPTLGSELAMPLPGMQNRLEPLAAGETAGMCEPAGGGTADALHVCIDSHLPQTATVGVRFVSLEGGRERGDLEIDFRWEDWSAAATTEITLDAKPTLTGIPLRRAVVRRGFRDVYAVRVGGAFRFERREGPDLHVRAGAAYDTAAAPVSWTRVDQDGKERVTVTGGLGIDDGWRRIDLGLGYVWEPTRLVEPLPVADPSNVSSRVQPDPLIPSLSPSQQLYHPINNGVHRSRYILGSVGVTVWW